MDRVVHVISDDEIERQLESLRLRVDVLERSFERVFGGPPAKYVRARRPQTALDVACDDCGAPKGLPCMTNKDRPTNPHVARIKAATRAEMMKRSR